MRQLDLRCVNEETKIDEQLKKLKEENFRGSFQTNTSCKSVIDGNYKLTKEMKQVWKYLKIVES